MPLPRSAKIKPPKHYTHYKPTTMLKGSVQVSSQAHIVDFETAKSASRARRGYRTSSASMESGARARFAVGEDYRATAEERLQARMSARGGTRPSRSNRRDASRREEPQAQPARSECKQSAFQKHRHDARKKKASRAFDRLEQKKPAAPSESGPRAAVYRGQMGSTHRKSARMQNERSTMQRANSAPARAAARKVRMAIAVPLTIVACFAACAVFLYAPARDYYTAVRDQAKTEAEYMIVSQENAELQSDVANLSTDEGMEDAARQGYGMVREGETSVRVSGLSEDSTSVDVTSLTPSTDIKAPDTWYSGVLDTVFGYSG